MKPNVLTTVRNELWVVGLCRKIRNFTGENPITFLSLLANLNDTSDNCGVCYRKAVCVLIYLLSDGSEKVYEAYIANIIKHRR